MIFSKLNGRAIVDSSRILFAQRILMANHSRCFVINRNNSSYESYWQNKMRIKNESIFNQYWNFKNLAIVIASTTLLGLAKLCINEKNDDSKDSNNTATNNLLDSFKWLFSYKDLQAKEETKNEKLLVITPRQKLFFEFASVEYEGTPYMTPQDFLESVTEDHPRPRIRRKVITKEMLMKYLKQTPGISNGSNKLFRNLEEKGIISYSEYLFLLCVITKPKSNFGIAFNMFDTDGNQQVDKNEFLVVINTINYGFESSVTQIFQRESESKTILEKESQKNEISESKPKLLDSLKVVNNIEHINTTLLVHLFGPKGKKQIAFEDFKKFSNDLQREILEIEFNEFSKGMNKISSIEFSEIVLRYTKFSQEKKSKILQRLNQNPESFTRGISFESFYKFSIFMNNLDDFALALKYHTQANRSISTNEFQRAVKISSGFTLDERIVQVIFNVFDENSDGHLSYKEFIAVLKGRLRRGLKSNGQSKIKLSDGQNAKDLTQSELLRSNDERQLVMTTFKNCIRRKLRESNYE